MRKEREKNSLGQDLKRSCVDQPESGSRVDARLNDLHVKTDYVLKNASGNRSSVVDGLVHGTKLPFIDKESQFPLLPKFKVPQIDAYDGLKDLVDHIETYRAHMELQVVLDEIMGRAFSISLNRSAARWFNSLQLRSVASFNELCQFIGGRTYWPKPYAYLLTDEQKEKKTPREYLSRFNKYNSVLVW